MRLFKISITFLLFVFIITSCKKEVEFQNNPPVVKLTKDTTLTLSGSAEESITLSGDAKDAEGSVISFLWSQVSGPNTAIISNPGSATTTFKGVIAGVYSFQLMATDNNGATGVAFIKVTLLPPPIVTVSLQPHYGSNDLFIAVKGRLNVGDNTAQEIGAITWTRGGEHILVRGLLKFDLSSIPSTAKIISASLTFYSNATT